MVNAVFLKEKQIQSACYRKEIGPPELPEGFELPPLCKKTYLSTLIN